MSSDQTYTRRINIYMDTGQAEASYNKLVQADKNYRDNLDELKKKQKEAADAVAKGSEEAKKKYDEVTKKIADQKNKLQDLLQQQEKSYQAAQTGGAKEAVAYDAVTASIKKQEAAIANLNTRAEKARLASEAGTPEAKKRFEDLTAQIARQETAMKSNTEAMERARKKVSGELSPNFKELTSVVKQLERELHDMSKEDAGFEAKRLQYNQAREALNQYGSSLLTVKERLKDFLKEARGAAVGVLVGNTVQAVMEKVTGSISGLISGAYKVADEVSAIQKTTNLSDAGVRELNAELSKFDTRTATSELRGLAAEAGKLGKESVEDIKRFVDEANQIKVALGEDLGEEATTQIGKVADIFDTSMLKIGSGINEIGQKSSAAESYVTQFIFRIAGGAKTLGIAAGDVLGYGAALDINGAQLEASATALQNVLFDFEKNAEKFGKTVGMAKGEMRKLIDDKGINAAFLEFLKRLRDTSSSSEELLKKMEALGIDGSRGAATFLTLAENIDLVVEQQKIANAAIADGSSITREYETRNNNLAGTIDRIGKEWAKLTTSREVLSWIEGGANVTLLFVRALSQVPTWINENRTAFSLLITMMVLYNRQKIASIISTTSETAVEIIGTTWKKAKAAATWLANAAVVAYNLTILAFTSRAGFAAAATVVWTKALQGLQLSMGVVVAAAAAISAAAKYYADNNEAAVKHERSRVVMASMLSRYLQALAEDQEKLNNTIKNYNTLSEEQRDNFREETKMKAEALKAEIAQLRAQQADVEDTGMATYGDALAVIGKVLTFQTKIADATDEIHQRSVKNGKEAAASYDNDIQRLEQGLKEYKQALEDTKPAIDLYAEAMLIAGINAEDLRKKIALLEKAMERATSKKDIAVIAKAIEDAKKQLEKFNVKVVDDKKMQSELDSFKKFMEKLAAIKREVDAAGENADIKELQRLKEKYIALEQEAKSYFDKGVISLDKYNKARLQIEKIYAKELEQLEDKQFMSRSEKELQASLNALQKYYEGVKLEEYKSYADGAISKETYEAKVQGIDSASKQAQYRVFMDYYDTLKEAYKNDADKTAQLEQQKVDMKNAAYEVDITNYIAALDRKRQSEVAQGNADVINAELGGNPMAIRDAKLAQVESDLAFELQLHKDNQEKINLAYAEAAAARKAIQEEYLTNMSSQISNFGSFVTSLFSGVNEILDRIDQRKLEASQAKYRKQSEYLKLQLDRRIITQKQYDQKVEALDKEQDRKELELKRKGFARNKAIRISEAVIATATGAIEAYKSMAGIPYVGPALGAIAAGAVAAFGAVKIGLIASEPAPSYGEGTIFGGDLHSDASKGNPVIDPKTGKVLARVERGEALISADTTAANMPVIRALHAAKGRSIAEQYGFARSNINYSRAYENIALENGGFFSTNRTGAMQAQPVQHFNSTYDSSRLERQNERIISLLEGLNDKDSGVTLTDFYQKEKTLKIVRGKQI